MRSTPALPAGVAAPHVILASQPPSLADIQMVLLLFISTTQWRIQGGAAGAPPPYRSRFFRFDIQIFRNVATSGVGAPPTRSPPPWEILDPLLKPPV